MMCTTSIHVLGRSDRGSTHFSMMSATRAGDRCLSSLAFFRLMNEGYSRSEDPITPPKD
jgi:hypothetical protein